MATQKIRCLFGNKIYTLPHFDISPDKFLQEKQCIITCSKYIRKQRNYQNKNKMQLMTKTVEF